MGCSPKYHPSSYSGATPYVFGPLNIGNLPSPSQCMGNNPCLQPLKKYCMNHRDIKKNQRPSICPLPSQYLLQPHPLTPRLPDIIYHCQPVIFRCREGPSQVLEKLDLCKGVAVGSERHLCSHLRFLCCQSAAFMLFLPSSDVCGGVPDIEGPLK